MPVLKRPASAEGANPKKRPASNSIKDVVDELKGVKEDESEAEEQCRDKQKAQKFHKMLQSGSLPDHIIHMYQVESKKAKEGVRNYQTKLINSLFQKGDDGTYRLMTDKHEFEQYRKVFHQTIAKDKAEAMPKTLMLASHFHGNEQLMKRALDNGELISKVDPSSKLEYLQFRKLSSIEVRGNEEAEKVKGTKKMSQDQAHTMASLMSKLKWKFSLAKALHGVGGEQKL